MNLMCSLLRRLSWGGENCWSHSYRPLLSWQAAVNLTAFGGAVLNSKWFEGPWTHWMTHWSMIHFHPFLVFGRLARIAVGACLTLGLWDCTRNNGLAKDWKRGVRVQFISNSHGTNFGALEALARENSPLPRFCGSLICRFCCSSFSCPNKRFHICWVNSINSCANLFY